MRFLLALSSSLSYRVALPSIVSSLLSLADFVRLHLIQRFLSRDKKKTQITYEDIEQCWAQYQFLDPTCDR